jgi:hypothetical protein
MDELGVGIDERLDGRQVGVVVAELDGEVTGDVLNRSRSVIPVVAGFDVRAGDESLRMMGGNLRGSSSVGSSDQCR